MATGGCQVHDRIGKKLICELCDTKVDTCIYKCIDCDNYMCDNCARAHHRVKLTRDHKILKDQHGPLPPSRAESRCTSHPGEDVLFYCYTCITFICSFCITSNHSNHKCSMIKQASEEMSAELRYELDNLKENHISVLRSHVKQFENLQTCNQEQHKSNVKIIQTQTDALVQEINKIQAKLIQKSEKTTNQNKSRLSELQDNVVKRAEKLESKYSDYNKVLTSGSDIDKIMARNEVLELLKTHQPHTQQAKIHNPKFVPGEIDLTSIKKLFGLIEVLEDDTSESEIFQTDPAKQKSAETISCIKDVKGADMSVKSSTAKLKNIPAPKFSNVALVKDEPVATKRSMENTVKRGSTNDNLATHKETSSNGTRTPASGTDQVTPGYRPNNTETDRTRKTASGTGQGTTGYRPNNTETDRTSKTASETVKTSGTSPNISLNIISQFKHKSDIVLSICPVSDTTAYLACCGECSIDRVDKTGQIQGSTKLDFEVFDFVVTPECDFICTDSGSTNICKVTKKGKITQQLYTGPLYPLCLCLSSDGHILATMLDEWSYDVNKDSKRLVTRLTTTGQILTTYEYDSDTRLFIGPTGIDENTNKDICVVNQTSDDSGHIVILDPSGRLKCTYKGQGNEMFDPIRVKCDKFGHIIVSDYRNKKIHVLNSNGQLIKHLMTDRVLQDYPYSLAIDTNNLLWVGCKSGRVYIVKYLEDTKTST